MLCASCRYSQALEGEMHRLHAEALSAAPKDGDAIRTVVDQLRPSLQEIADKFPMDLLTDEMDGPLEQVLV